ncbi:MAG: type 1 glutamine amidotransferase domain-containing protein [Pseudomonadota bacterium]
MKALMLSADNFEDSELLVPYYRLQEAGIDVDIASLRKGKITGKHGYEVQADLALEDVRPDDYDLLILPGGKAPEALRKQQAALAISRAFFQGNKPVAAICHGAQTLISAGVLRGRRATCYKSVAPEMKDAGAFYEDKEVVIDGNLITSRQPADLPAFMRAVMNLMQR